MYIFIYNIQYLHNEQYYKAHIEMDMLMIKLLGVGQITTN